MSRELNALNRRVVPLQQEVDRARALASNLEREVERLKAENGRLGGRDAVAAGERLGKWIRDLSGDAQKRAPLMALYKSVCAGGDRKHGQLFRQVGNMNLQANQGDLDSVERVVLAIADGELPALKRAMRLQHEELQKKNGGTGIFAYLEPNGSIVQYDRDADMQLKKTHAPTLFRLLENVTTSTPWRRAQKQAKAALAHGVEFYEFHKQKYVKGADLEAWIERRRVKHESTVLFLFDMLINAHSNGAHEIRTPLLLYMSLSRMIDGQSQRSIAHDSALAVATSYGTAHRFWGEAGDRYKATFKSRVLDLLKTSNDAAHDFRDGLRNLLSVDQLYDDGDNYELSIVVGWLVDNYVKGGKAVLRHLMEAGNLKVIQTLSALLIPFKRNCLRSPRSRLSTTNPPYSAIRINDYFSSDRAPRLTSAGGSKRRWKANTKACYRLTFERRRPVPCYPHRSRLRNYVVVPQFEGASSKRVDFVKCIENLNDLSGGVILSDRCHLVIAADTEFIRHNMAFLEAQKPVRHLERPAPRSRLPSSRAPSLVVRGVRPVLRRDARRRGRGTSRDRHGHGRRRDEARNSRLPRHH